jgi:2-C-methyl-D-erythritol 4-phosphate cytidylyltransferase
VRVGALLLGAGRGERLAGQTPKAFAKLAGRPLLEYAVDAVDECPDVEGYVLAVPRGWEARAEGIAARSPKHVATVMGAETRQGSVRAALGALPDGYTAVVCHDVARPLASQELFRAVVAALAEADGAVPAVPVPDTVKRVEQGRVTGTLPRDDLMLIQTPQAFRREPLEASHRAASDDGFLATDDSALLERAGYYVTTVPGDPINLKITSLQDLQMAAVLAHAGG